MPKMPFNSESKSAFVGRCVAYLIRKEGKTQDQALGQCYGMWKQSKKKKETLTGK